VDGKQDLLGVWSLPGIVHDKSPPELKLGGTGLGLVALCSLKNIDPGVVSLDTLKKWGISSSICKRKMVVFIPNSIHIKMGETTPGLRSITLVKQPLAS